MPLRSVDHAVSHCARHPIGEAEQRARARVMTADQEFESERHATIPEAVHRLDECEKRDGPRYGGASLSLQVPVHMTHSRVSRCFGARRP